MTVEGARENSLGDDGVRGDGGLVFTASRAPPWVPDRVRQVEGGGRVRGRRCWWATVSGPSASLGMTVEGARENRLG